MPAPRATAAAFAVVAAAIAVYAYGDARPTPVDPSLQDADAVAVLPFSVQGAQPALVDLRDAIQDLIAARFPGGDGTPRALDQAVVQGALRRVVPADKADVSSDVARRIVGELGAGHVLRGEVRGTPEDLAVAAEFVTVSDGAVRARAVMRGDADRLPTSRMGSSRACSRSRSPGTRTSWRRCPQRRCPRCAPFWPDGTRPVGA